MDVVANITVHEVALDKLQNEGTIDILDHTETLRTQSCCPRQ